MEMNLWLTKDEELFNNIFMCEWIDDKMSRLELSSKFDRRNFAWLAIAEQLWAEREGLA